jgi:hypothetical protein
MGSGIKPKIVEESSRKQAVQKFWAQQRKKRQGTGVPQEQATQKRQKQREHTEPEQER